MTKQAYRIEKGYFRNDRRFGRITKLMLNGECVLSVLGVSTKGSLVSQYEGTKSVKNDEITRHWEIGQDDMIRDRRTGLMVG